VISRHVPFEPDKVQIKLDRGKSVSTPADIRKGLADAKTDGKHTVLFRVKSRDGTRFVALPLGNA